MIRSVACSVALLIGSAACTAEAPHADRLPRFGTDVEGVLDGARRALGGASIDQVADITTRAAVTGPAGDFETVLLADRTGRARMLQTGGFAAVIDSARAWAIDSEGHWTQAGPDTGALVRGHALHVLALDPGSLFVTARLGPPTTFEGSVSLPVRYADHAGREVIIYYAARDSLPLGIRVLWTDPVVVAGFERWDALDGVRVFREARFRQGDETFAYRFDEIRFNTLSPDTFDVR